MHRLRLFIVIVVLILMAGCATQRRRDSLADTLTAYGTALRWGDFQRALEFVDPAYRAAHPLTTLQRKRYKQVRVVGYDQGKGPVPVSPTMVRQTAKIGVLNRHTMGERFVVDHQVWKWDPQAGHWWLESGLPDITQSAP